VERRHRARSLEFGIEVGGLLQGVRIDVLDGVELGPGLVIGRDTIEVGLNELGAAQSARSHRRVNAIDGRLDDIEVGGGGGGGGGLRNCR
jgi:hypothetical protein